MVIIKVFVGDILVNWPLRKSAFDILCYSQPGNKVEKMGLSVVASWLMRHADSKKSDLSD